MGVDDIQKYIRSIDHNPSLEAGYFQKLIEEVGELAKALRKRNVSFTSEEDFKGSAAEELYDVLYYVCAIANIHDISLSECHMIKTRINNKKYGRDLKEK